MFHDRQTGNPSSEETMKTVQLCLAILGLPLTMIAPQGRSIAQAPPAQVIHGTLPGKKPVVPSAKPPPARTVRRTSLPRTTIPPVTRFPRGRGRLVGTGNRNGFINSEGPVSNGGGFIPGGFYDADGYYQQGGIVLGGNGGPSVIGPSPIPGGDGSGIGGGGNIMTLWFAGAPVPTGVIQGQYFAIVTHNVNLKSQPVRSRNAGVILRPLISGTWVEVFGEFQDFAAVSLEDGETGWVRQNFLAQRALPVGIVFSRPKGSSSSDGTILVNDPSPTDSAPAEAVTPSPVPPVSAVTYNGKLIGVTNLWPHPTRVIGGATGTVPKDALVRIQIGQDGHFVQHNGYFQVTLTGGEDGWLPVNMIQVTTPPPGGVVPPTTL
jgi:hypothetical protein